MNLKNVCHNHPQPVRDTNCSFQKASRRNYVKGEMCVKNTIKLKYCRAAELSWSTHHFLQT